MLCPARNARNEEACTAGPSAMGSENGMPISIRSAPAAGRPNTICLAVSPSGSPAVTKATKAARPWRFRSAKRRSMRDGALICLASPHSHRHAQVLGDGKDVLVSATAHVHHQQVVARERRCQLAHEGKRVRRLKCRNDAFHLAAHLKGFQ